MKLGLSWLVVHGYYIKSCRCSLGLGGGGRGGGGTDVMNGYPSPNCSFYGEIRGSGFLIKNLIGAATCNMCLFLLNL